MDRRERFIDQEETLRAAHDDFASSTWTAIPGIVQSFSAADMTVQVQPAIKARLRNEAGDISYIALPLLVDVPVLFPSGGGYTMTFPIAANDECLVIFSARCIDGWWESSGVQNPAEIRMHDLSDGFAFIGPRSRPRALSDVSTDTVQLRSDDGETYIELSGGGLVNVVAPGGMVFTTPTLTVSGDVIAGDISLQHHVHSGVTTGGSNTGEPV